MGLFILGAIVGVGVLVGIELLTKDRGTSEGRVVELFKKFDVF